MAKARPWPATYPHADYTSARELARRARDLAATQGRSAGSVETMTGTDGGEDAPIEELTRRTLRILHQLVATGDRELAVAELEELLLQTLAVARQSLGSDSLDIAASLRDLADLYQAAGQYGDAAATLRESLRLVERRLGDSHQESTNICHDLAGIEQNRGDHAAAEALARQAYERRRATLGHGHTETAATGGLLGRSLVTQARYEEAETLLRESIAVLEAADNRCEDVVTNLDHLAAALAATKRGDEAMSVYRKALHLRRQLLGEDHPAIANTLHNLALLADARGFSEEAGALWAEARRILDIPWYAEGSPRT